jgi:uracil phosphoribosyltransferase
MTNQGQVTVLSDQPSLIDHLLTEVRDQARQVDRARFRAYLSKIGFLLGYEISKSLAWQPSEGETVLAKFHSHELKDSPVLIGVLRAGLPLLEGLQMAFDQSDVGFLGAYRSYQSEGDDFEIAMDYVATPSLEGRDIILVDTMLATGKSLVKGIELLIKQQGTPKTIYVASAIAAQPGVDYIISCLPQVKIYAAGVDQILNEHQYIVPGLGDAGDLAYGPKL